MPPAPPRTVDHDRAPRNPAAPKSTHCSDGLERVWAARACKGQLARQASGKQARAGAAAFNLTGRTGSLMYMAPEVYLQQPYNEKVGVIMFRCVPIPCVSACACARARVRAKQAAELQQDCRPQWVPAVSSCLRLDRSSPTPEMPAVALARVDDCALHALSQAGPFTQAYFGPDPWMRAAGGRVQLWRHDV